MTERLQEQLASCTRDGSNSFTNAAHVDTSLELDETILSPTGAPAVLDQPVVNSALPAVANHTDGMINLVGGGTSGNDSSMLVDQFLHQVLIAPVGVVGVGDSGALVEDGHVSGAGESGVGVPVRVLSLTGKPQLGSGSPGQVGMRGSSIAAVGSLLFVTAVNQLLFRVVTKDSSNFLEAGFNGVHAGKSNARSTLLLILHRGNKTSS